MDIFVYPYNKGSEGAKELALLMEAPRIKRENSKFRGNRRKIVVNWGNSGNLPEEVLKCEVLNAAEDVARVSNKLRFFESMVDHVTLPPFTTAIEEARNWLEEQRCTIFARTVLNGHSGQGIIEINTQEQLNDIPEGTLLVKYVPKKDEYRVHCMSGDLGVIDVQRKARKLLVAEPNWRIRNKDNGFIYARGNTRETPKVVLDEALKAFNQSHLDFGGVDVIYNKKQRKAYVLEINTAPGLEGTTVRRYASNLLALAGIKTGQNVDTNVPAPVVPPAIYIDNPAEDVVEYHDEDEDDEDLE